MTSKVGCLLCIAGQGKGEAVHYPTQPPMRLPSLSKPPPQPTFYTQQSTVDFSSQASSACSPSLTSSCIDTGLQLFGLRSLECHPSFQSVRRSLRSVRPYSCPHPLRSHPYHLPSGVSHPPPHSHHARAKLAGIPIKSANPPVQTPLHTVLVGCRMERLFCFVLLWKCRWRTCLVFRLWSSIRLFVPCTVDVA